MDGVPSKIPPIVIREANYSSHLKVGFSQLVANSPSPAQTGSIFTTLRFVLSFQPCAAGNSSRAQMDPCCGNYAFIPHMDAFYCNCAIIPHMVAFYCNRAIIPHMVAFYGFHKI